MRFMILLFISLITSTVLAAQNSAPDYFVGQIYGESFSGIGGKPILEIKYPDGRTFLNETAGSYQVEIYSRKDWGSAEQVRLLYSGTVELLGTSVYTTSWVGNEKAGYTRYKRRRYFLNDSIKQMGYVDKTIDKEWVGTLCSDVSKC